MNPQINLSEKKEDPESILREVVEELVPGISIAIDRIFILALEYQNNSTTLERKKEILYIGARLDK